MADPTDTAPPTKQGETPALAASVGAVRTEKPWAVNVKPTPEQYGAWLKACTDEERVEAATIMWAALDEANECFTHNHKATEAVYLQTIQRMADLERQRVELTAQRDLARDAAVALEQENARLSERLRPPRDDGMAGATHPMVDPYKRAEASPAAVLGLGLQPETSEQ